MVGKIILYTLGKWHDFFMKKILVGLVGVLIVFGHANTYADCTKEDDEKDDYISHEYDDFVRTAYCKMLYIGKPVQAPWTNAYGDDGIDPGVIIGIGKLKASVKMSNGGKVLEYQCTTFITEEDRNNLFRNNEFIYHRKKLDHYREWERNGCKRGKAQ